MISNLYCPVIRPIYVTMLCGSGLGDKKCRQFAITAGIINLKGER